MIADLYAGWAEGKQWGDLDAGFAVLLGMIVFVFVVVMTLRGVRWVYQILGVRS